MRLTRILYRFRQFRHAISDRPVPEDIGIVSQVLTPKQLALFQRMHPGEQSHSIRVFRQLWDQHHGQVDEVTRALFVAALLHDVGKTRHPLRVWERVLIVLGKTFFPGLVRRWGAEDDSQASSISKSPGWRRPFLVSEQHARWGAEMAAKAGASQLAVSLILNHQNLFPSKIVSIEDRLLYELQSADHRS